MSITDAEIRAAEARMSELRRDGYAISAHYDAVEGRISVRLSTGEDLSFAPADADELAQAAPDDLADIEIVPGGLGLIWPRLDAGLYVPALKLGILGSKRWMAEAARQ